MRRALQNCWTVTQFAFVVKCSWSAGCFANDWISGCFSPSASCRTVLELFAANSVNAVFTCPHPHLENCLRYETNKKLCIIYLCLLKIQLMSAHHSDYWVHSKDDQTPPCSFESIQRMTSPRFNPVLDGAINTEATIHQAIRDHRVVIELSLWSLMENRF